MKRFPHLRMPMSALLASVILGCGAAYKGPPSDHFDGDRFFDASPDHTFGTRVKWLWEMKTVPWPKWIDDPRFPAPPERVFGKRLRCTYINHATLLIQTDGLNILTDPIWSKRAGPVSWIGAVRIRRPGTSMADLPRIDVVLISHDHYDHLDIPSLKAISRRDRPIVLAGLGLEALLTKEGIAGANEMEWCSPLR